MLAAKANGPTIKNILGSVAGITGNCDSEDMSRAAHRRMYSFFTAIRAPSFITIFTQTHHIPLPQLVQAVTGYS